MGAFPDTDAEFSMLSRVYADLANRIRAHRNLKPAQIMAPADTCQGMRRAVARAETELLELEQAGAIRDHVSG